MSPSRRRPLPLLIAGATAAALLLAGCSGGGSGDDPTTPSTDASETTGAEVTEGSEGMPQASGEFGESPNITFPGDTPPEGLQVEVLSEGDGPEVEPSSAVTANYYGIVWGADAQFDDSYSRGAPSMFGLNQVIQGWTDGIPGHTVGSRLLISVPPDLGYGPQGGNPDAGIGAEDTIVFVVDVVEAFNPGDAGQADATPTPEAADAPVTIDGNLGEPVTFTIAEGATEPTELQVTVLATGTGEPVANQQSVAVAYAFSYWDGSGAGSSWGWDGADPEGPFTSFAGQGSIVDATIDVPVGSRVLVLAPATDQAPASAAIIDVLGTA
ncbi:peptidylprolyl isomerase [Occultella glacieicola]|uniref:peptidylprolyl isomerase n=1 Tax=Occultella glacieicola TaxID=2518684 RepID=A0ABY2DXX0_9MICO|nr:FKBP-type peptidyl-prolyl cis-trans isomerase [Occultella glacieicola]TDE88969.1 peptidylprolyl isomerase [Occultella glacieicola]